MVIVWYEITCAKCGASNFMNNGDPEDMTVTDEDAFECWGCGNKAYLSEYETGEPPEDMYCSVGENLRGEK